MKGLDYASMSIDGSPIGREDENRGTVAWEWQRQLSLYLVGVLDGLYQQA